MKCYTMTTDEILERLSWICDRQRYRRICGLHEGADYADECKAESELLRELGRRLEE